MTAPTDRVCVSPCLWWRWTPFPPPVSGLLARSRSRRACSAVSPHSLRLLARSRHVAAWRISGSLMGRTVRLRRRRLVALVSRTATMGCRQREKKRCDAHAAATNESLRGLLPSHKKATVPFSSTGVAYSCGSSTMAMKSGRRVASRVPLTPFRQSRSDPKVIRRTSALQPAQRGLYFLDENWS